MKLSSRNIMLFKKFIELCFFSLKLHNYKYKKNILILLKLEELKMRHNNLNIYLLFQLNFENNNHLHSQFRFY